MLIIKITNCLNLLLNILFILINREFGCRVVAQTQPIKPLVYRQSEILPQSQLVEVLIFLRSHVRIISIWPTTIQGIVYLLCLSFIYTPYISNLYLSIHNIPYRNYNIL